MTTPALTTTPAVAIQPCLLLSLIHQEHDNPADEGLWRSVEELAEDYPVLYEAHQATLSPCMLTLHLDVESFGELLGCWLALHAGARFGGQWRHSRPVVFVPLLDQARAAGWEVEHRGVACIRSGHGAGVSRARGK